MTRRIVGTSTRFTLMNLIAFFVVSVGLRPVLIGSSAENQSAAISPGNFFRVIKKVAAKHVRKRDSSVSFNRFTFPSRVVEGDDAEDGEFPFMVSLQHHYSQTPWCGGTLLSANMVLTAAHCIGYRGKGPDYDVLAGTVDGYGFYGVSPHSQRKRGLQVFLHPNFTLRPLLWDMALIKTEPFTLDGTYVNVHRLAHFPNLTWIWEQAENHPPCTGLGWGSTYPDRVPKAIVLQKVKLELQPRSICLAKLTGFSADQAFCAVGGFSQDTCQGDSGGPLVCKIEKGMDPIVVGVVSWGNGCARLDLPAAYARVDSTESWLRSIIATESGCLKRAQTKLLLSVSLISAINF